MFCAARRHLRRGRPSATRQRAINPRDPRHTALLARLDQPLLIKSGTEDRAAMERAMQKERRLMRRLNPLPS